MLHHKKAITMLMLASALSNQAFAMDDHSAHNHATHSHSMASTVGKLSDVSHANKTIKVDLLDSMRFEFHNTMDIKEGDIVRFVVTNKGEIDHEFSIGSEKEQKAHLEMMKQMPNMVHSDGSTITVKPNETKELTWKFTKRDTVMFACNIPEHFEAGMHYKVVIK
ncbi:cupredoxin domain-containing protein [Sulfurospirillum halorespirans]|uniref:Cupredoxin-like protein n=1 Tax=Sulfurospirillum halorespirans DSM 13726 TaxID=1193502 RepID=A0A1D7TNM4_9BACT|nr:cupredoxin family protein [Sulfurospirillum halorespirans]AOO66596.1 cupredoxin-like protein [Sulfurospirillum halorespirans DSM 13726]